MGPLHQFTTLEAELELARLKWETEFPAETSALQNLREALIVADCTQLQSRAAFQALQTVTDSTGWPMHEWDPALLRTFTYLKRQHQLDSRHCTLALKALQEAYALHQMTQAKAIQTAAKTPDPIEVGNIFHEQIAEVTVLDGQVITSVNRSAAYWLEKNLWRPNTIFVRRFYFPDLAVPDPYLYVLAHEDVASDPARYFAISYSPHEFERLCRLELETGSAYLLDGERLDYRRIE